MIGLSLLLQKLNAALFHPGRVLPWVKVFILFFVLIDTAPALAQQTIDSAYLPQLKAAYLINFVRYTEWAQTPDIGVLNLCSPSPATLNGELANLGQVQAGDKTVNIMFVGQEQDELLADCQILFLDSVDDMINRHFLEQARNLPVLIVSDKAGYFEAGLCHIQFEIIQNKLRFSINQAKALQDNLVISSFLLRLASRVITE